MIKQMFKYLFFHYLPYGTSERDRMIIW